MKLFNFLNFRTNIGKKGGKVIILEEQMRKNKKILDKIDFIPYLKQEEDVEKIMHYVTMEFDNTELTDNDVCQGCTFNWLTTEEFADYLTERYGDKVSTYEETITKTCIKLIKEDD